MVALGRLLAVSAVRGRCSSRLRLLLLIVCATASVRTQIFVDALRAAAAALVAVLSDKKEISNVYVCEFNSECISRTHTRTRVYTPV